ncbi:MAG TPA: hypothetical protein PLU95_07705 [Syntrophales bacterium]|nr:hypothetical protein [Syntrophales bacterium]HPX81478.1 hypothetical protein [Syntrophales bacterium]
MNKEDISTFAINLGADAVGFAAIGDYRSKKSPDPKLILPTVKSMVVMAYRELDGSLDSLDTRTGMSGRMALMELSQKNAYPLGAISRTNTGSRRRRSSCPILQYNCFNCLAGCTVGERQ